MHSRRRFGLSGQASRCRATPVCVAFVVAPLVRIAGSRMSTNETWLADSVAAAPVEAAQRLAEQNRGRQPATNGTVNILMVDDRPEKLLALEAVLSSLGQNLVRAKSGKDALRHLLKEEFAVILLDVAMPGMDGFET